MSEFNKVLSKSVDTIKLFADRAALQIDEAKDKIQNQLTQTSFERKLIEIKQEVRKTVNPTFWDRNKETIMIGSAIAVGSLILMLIFKK